MSSRRLRPLARLLSAALAGVRGPALGLAAIAAAAPMMALAPEPDPVPRRWQLDVEVGPLRVATVSAERTGPRTYLYLPYRVINNSGEDLLFAPMWELSDGSGRIVRSGRDVPQEVTATIVRSLRNPLIEDQIEIIGDLLQGEEHAKDGVVIWPLNDLAPERLTIYAAGFSGETDTVTAPDGKSTFVLRKTLRLQYDTPGSLRGQGAQPIPLRSKDWIMR